MTYQITVIKLEGYGAWTLGLGSDREHQLQILQSKIYSDLQEYFSNRNGIVFFNRFDEYIVVTNNINIQEHKNIYDIIEKKYNEIKLSMTIGQDETPLKTIKKIHWIKKDRKNEIFPNLYGITNNDNTKYQREKISNEIIAKRNGNSDIKILHVDIDGSTKKSRELSAYEITNLVVRLYSLISDAFLKEESLAFYLGGDNFMIIAKKNMQAERVKEIIDILVGSSGIKLNCGIGNGNTARKAVERATKSLDTIRQKRKNGIFTNVYELS